MPENELEIISKISSVNKIDPMEFDMTISALLIGLGAEKYVDIFRKNNIGQCTLTELSEEDLIKLGIHEPQIRTKLLNEVKNLPIYEETSQVFNNTPNLGLIEIVNILEESSQHLNKVYLSMLANTLALKKSTNVSDCLLFRDKYASDISLATLSEITNILNSIHMTLHSELKVLIKESNSTKNKKIFVGAIGTTAIAVLTLLFLKSLKQLKQ